MAPIPSSPKERQSAAERAARLFCLPFSHRVWRGTQGNLEGRGTGNSLDFQDHRAYQWGDDPRAIHWAAYARTGQLSLKMFRAELTPHAEIAVDVSASMFVDARRAARTEELLLFCALSAVRAGARVSVHAVAGKRSCPLALEDVLAGTWRNRLPEWPPDETMPVFPARYAGGMRVFLSDLLFPGEPSSLLASMVHGGGRSLLLAPTLPEEAAFMPTGNVRLKNCESGRARDQYLSGPLCRRYARAYRAHFDLWESDCRRRGAIFSRVACELPLVESLKAEAFPRGAVEPA